MDKRKVKTKGSLKEMAQYTNLNEQMIQEMIGKVENEANIDVQTSEKKEKQE